MSLKSMFSVPVIPVNNYIWDTMKRIEPSLEAEYEGVTPFFPLADSRGGDANWGDKPYIVYDVTTRKREESFYVCHDAQFYYFVRGQAEDVLVWTNAIQHIIDRADDAAKDVNAFMAAEHPDDANVFFYNFKAFMQDQVNDKRMDLAVKQFYTMSMIVETTYHLNNDNANFELPYGKGSLYEKPREAEVTLKQPEFIESETTQAIPEPKPAGEVWKRVKPKKKLEW